MKDSCTSIIQPNLAKVNNIYILFNLDNICQVVIEIVKQNSFKLSKEYNIYTNTISPPY